MSRRTNRRKTAKRPARRPRRAPGRPLVFGLAAVLTVALAAIAWLMIVYPSGQGPGRGREITLSLSGDSFDSVVEELARAGVVGSPRVFAIYARLIGADDRVRIGEVLLTDDMSPRDVVQRIATGFGHATVRVTIPEGFHRFAVAARLERWGVCTAEELIEASEDRALLDELDVEGPTAEGYLFPDTYRFEEGLGGEEAVRRMVGNWHRRVDPILEEHPDALRELEEGLSWGPHQALVLASIVEKEAVVSEERPIIARVFMNRLRDPDFRPKRLQADPTVSYGCLAMPERAPSCADFDGRRILRVMLHDRANPYNTYRHEGLPPGPICNPGLDSIRAVLTAPANDYLYFVARGQGRHTFSATLAEHNAAVARYRRGQR